MMPTTSGDAYAAPGRAMQQMGSAISGLGDALFEAQQKEDGFDAKLKMLNHSNDVDMAAIKYQQDYQGDPKQYEQGLRNIYQQRTEKLYQEIPQSQRRQASLYDAQKRGSTFESAARHQSQLVVGQRYAEVESTIAKGIASLEGVAPEQFDAELTKILTFANTAIDTMPGSTPAHQESLRNKVSSMLESTLLAAPKDGATSVEQLLKWQRIKPLMDGFVKSKTDPNAADPFSGAPGPQSSAGGGGGLAKITPASGSHSFVTASSGARLRVSSDYADRFAGLVSDLEAAGVKINPSESGGYANRNIAGTSTKSKHSFGEAIDVNWSQNPRGGMGEIVKQVPPDQIRQIAAKNGLKWGGDWKNPDPMHFEVDKALTVAARGAPADQVAGGIAPKLTAYSPQAGGSRMEGGYAASKPGPDGKAEVRTLEDVAAGRSKYITVAGDPSQYGKTYTIPRIEWIDSQGKRQVSENVQAVVHDTGSAFKGKGDQRFDVPVARDLTNAQMNSQPFLKGGVQFIPQGQETKQGGPVRVASLGGGPTIPGSNDNAAPTKLPPKVVENLKGLTPEQKDAKLRDLVSRGYQDIVHQLDADGNDVLAAKQSDKPAWQRGRRGTNSDGTIPNELDSETFAGPGWANGAVKDIKDGKLKRAENTIPGGGVQVAQATGQPRLVPSVESKLMESLLKKKEAIYNQDLATVGKLVERAETVAKEGNILPDADRQMTEKAMQLMGMPKPLVDRYNLANMSAFEANQQQRSRPDQIQARKIALQAEIAKTGEATPELQAKIKGLDDLAKHVDKELDTNMIGWGEKIGLVPKLPPIDPAKPDLAALQARGDAARYLSGYYGREPQFFTSTEREGLTTALKKGGDESLVTLGTMHIAFKEQLPQVMREIAKDAPEAAVAGSLFAINPQAARDIMKAVARENDPNSKGKIHKPNRGQSEPAAQAELGDVFRKFPPQQRDAVLNAADAIYTVRNVKPNEWDEKIYKQAIKDVIGVRVDKEGNTFGGPVATGDGWFGASGKNIMLPPTWRADKWRETLEGVTAKDLAEAGLPLPASADGKAISAVRLVNKGKLVQIGHGQYMVAMGDPDVPGQEKWVSAMPHAAHPPVVGQPNNGVTNLEPFVWDLNKLEPILRKRLTVPFWKKD